MPVFCERQQLGLNMTQALHVNKYSTMEHEYNKAQNTMYSTFHVLKL